MIASLCTSYINRGSNPKDSISGGGAGGSLFITANRLKGHGVFDVRGGDGGMTSGGGGSGGILAVYYKSSHLLFTTLLHGGSGKRNGASGFFFQRHSASGEESSKLILNNIRHTTVNTSSVLVCDPKLIDLRYVFLPFPFDRFFFSQIYLSSKMFF